MATVPPLCYLHCSLPQRPNLADSTPVCGLMRPERLRTCGLFTPGTQIAEAAEILLMVCSALSALLRLCVSFGTEFEVLAKEA